MISGMVSCIVPTYKRSDTLLRAIKSILSQTYSNLEVIVVDDNNPNDEYSLVVQEKLSTITDERLKYIQQEKHINGAAARNAGIHVSKGEYIAFLDDDDEWLPKKLELQIKQLELSDEYGGASCLYSLYSEGKLIRECQPYTNEELHRKVLERSVEICTPTLVLRKDALDITGYFDETMIRHQELQLILDFLSNNKLLVLPEYLVRVHIDTGENRPTAESLIEIKQHFFEKMLRHFKLYDEKTQKRIYAAHFFEIVLVALRENKLRVAVKYFVKIGLNLKAYWDLLRRIRQRNK